MAARDAGRRGFSLVEVLVGVALLGGALAALLTFGTQEVRIVGLTEERYHATQALEDLQEVFGGKPLYYYRDRGFPATFDAFDALLASNFELHPLVLPLPDPAAASTVERELVARADQMAMRRAVLFEPFTTPAGGDAGVVSFVVRYRTRSGQERQVSTVRVVYE